MPKDSIVFLMYHELESQGRSVSQNEPGYARYVLSDKEFEAQCDFLREKRLQGVSVSQALAFPANSVAITFDDGCETDLLTAAPILRRAGFGATFFITTGRIGAAGYLSPSQLKELHQLGFEIGCHSMTHPYLTDLDEKELQSEIGDAKTQLEQILGSAIEHFSCPGGRWDERTLRTARAAGYKSVCTSQIQANDRNTDWYRLGRVAMLRGVSLPTFGAICDGSKLASMRAKGKLRETAKNLLGNRVYDRLRERLLRD